ncbi:MAG: arginine decarboxylase [Firmicutes bacterium HGW-Firmicutes-13]|nr:MAG: arginine decarboxylase [Firmicutes bacterium HGW-Firmicutes-13]
MDQNRSPLLEGLINHLAENYRSFHVPAHQGSRNMDKLLKILLEDPCRFDLTELPGLDNLQSPRGIIKESQALAAELFGAQETYFLVNGTTGGLLTMVNTVCRPGEKIIIPRQVHQAVFGGIITSGAVPVYISSNLSPDEQRIYNVSLSEVERALEENPGAKALLVNNPTYYGVCADLLRIRELTSEREVMLLVDEAQGGHFTFHSEFPPGASEAGADMWVQSTHKTLGSLTQSSMLHVGSSRVDRGRLMQMLRIFQSTSPSYILLASLDAARRQLAVKGSKLLDTTLRLAGKAREKAAKLGFILLTAQNKEFKLDITKLALFTHNFSESGTEIASILRENYKIQAELYSGDHILFLLTLGHDEKDLKFLLDGLEKVRTGLNCIEREDKADIKKILPPVPLQILTPGEAVNSEAEDIPLVEAEGRICAEIVNYFPPGVPLILPGELITPEILNYFMNREREGAVLPQIKVVKL